MTTLPLSSAHDLLALIPHRLGFVPRRSIALLCADDAPGATLHAGLVVRLDLPASGEKPAAAVGFIEAVRRSAPVALLAVGYEDRPGECVPALEATCIAPTVLAGVPLLGIVIVTG